MKMRIISLFTLAAFMFFSWSCMTHHVKKEDAKTVADSKKSDIKIIGIQTNKGEYLEFSEQDPATFSNRYIEGTALVE